MTNTNECEMCSEYEEYLEHYGVQGMKWGVRKEAPKGAVRKAKNASTKGASIVMRNISKRISSTGKDISAAVKRNKELRRDKKLIETAKKDPSKLTDAELDRVAKRVKNLDAAKAALDSSKAVNNEKYDTSKKAAKKAAKNSDKLSDAELQYRLDRTRKENELKGNTSKAYTKEHKVAKAVGETSLRVATGALEGTLKWGVSRALHNAGLGDLASVATGIKPEKHERTAKDLNDLVDRANKDPRSLNQEELNTAKRYETGVSWFRGPDPSMALPRVAGPNADGDMGVKK